MMWRFLAEDLVADGRDAPEARCPHCDAPHWLDEDSPPGLQILAPVPERDAAGAEDYAITLVWRLACRNCARPLRARAFFAPADEEARLRLEPVLTPAEARYLAARGEITADAARAEIARYEEEGRGA